MSNIAIKGATTGTGVFTLESPATNTDRTLILPDEAGTVLTTAGVPASAMPAGSVIQVVHNTPQTSLLSFTPSVGLQLGPSITITPTSSSSKILLTASYTVERVGGVNDDPTNYYWDDFFRDGTALNPTNIGESAPLGNAVCYKALINARQAVSGSHVDSPNTTSPVTYSVRVAVVNGGVVYYMYGFRLTAMEIVG